jgi:hypothetical protein
MKLHTLLIAGVASVVLSGAALAAPVDITVQQTSAGGRGSQNNATINSNSRGSQNLFLSQDGAQRQNANVNANSSRGNIVGTFSQTNGGRNNLDVKANAPRGGVDLLSVQEARFSNNAKFNVTAGRAGASLVSYQDAGRRNDLNATIRTNGPVSVGAAQNTFRPGGINNATVNVNPLGRLPLGPIGPRR